MTVKQFNDESVHYYMTGETNGQLLFMKWRKSSMCIVASRVSNST